MCIYILLELQARIHGRLLLDRSIEGLLRGGLFTSASQDVETRIESGALLILHLEPLLVKIEVSQVSIATNPLVICT